MINTLLVFTSISNINNNNINVKYQRIGVATMMSVVFALFCSVIENHIDLNRRGLLVDL